MSMAGGETFSRGAVPPYNNRMEPTYQSVTPLAFARAAPLCYAAHPKR